MGYGGGEFDLDGYLSAELDEEGRGIGSGPDAQPCDPGLYPADPNMIAEQQTEAERWPGPSTTGYAQAMAARREAEAGGEQSGRGTVGGIPVDVGQVDIPSDRDLGLEAGS